VTDSERRKIEAMAKYFRAVTGRPLIVVASLYADMKRLGIDTSDVRVLQPIPMHTRTPQ